MKKRKIFACFAAILLLFGLCGCNSYELKVGGYYSGDSLQPIVSAVRSKKKDLPLENIELELSYGGHLSVYNEEKYGRRTIGLNIFICNYEYLKNIKIYSPNAAFPYVLYDSMNFTEIEGLYFYKFIMVDDFDSDEYDVKTSIFTDPVINHSETVKVPQEVIEGEKGNFCFAFVETGYHISTEKYFINHISELRIGYKMQKNNVVRLSKP